MAKKIVVNGGCGRMGQEVIKTIIEETEEKLVGVYDKKNVGKDIIKEMGLNGPEVRVNGDLEKLIKKVNPDTIIDFTIPRVIMENIRTGLKNRVNMIVGTTGITDTDLEEIKKLTSENDVNIIIAPNFAIGAILLMKFAAEANKYFKDAEIIELHHDQKIDAPSGTAIKTAEIMDNCNNDKKNSEREFIESIPGVRGGKKKGINIHSVRLPGLIAHQEVILGGRGQSLKIRHDSYSRESFMPGVKLALDKVDKIDGLVYGLENVMD